MRRSCRSGAGLEGRELCSALYYATITRIAGRLYPARCGLPLDLNDEVAADPLDNSK